MQANREIKEHICCEGRCNTHCPHKKNTGELYYPLEGNIQEHISKMSKFLDGLPMSLGEAQHEQIRNQWPNSVVKNDYLYYGKEQDQNTEQKHIGHMNAKFASIADIANGEF